MYITIVPIRSIGKKLNHDDEKKISLIYLLKGCDKITIRKYAHVLKT